MKYIPYTYLIGWSVHKKFYYGVEYARSKKIANPENLWIKYFTSSNSVKHFRALWGEPDVIQIRKIFTEGTDIEKMEAASRWERKVLSRVDITREIWLNGRIGGDICASSNAKNNLLRYGVVNVFGADEIKEKIKETNIKRYGVDHPSKSDIILRRKADNNIVKWGHECTLHNKTVKNKVRNTMIERYGVPFPLQSQIIKDKTIDTIKRRYGVVNAGQIPAVKEKVRESRKKMSERDVVKEIRKYTSKYKLKLGSGWYQSSDSKLATILEDFRAIYGAII